MWCVCINKNRACCKSISNILHLISLLKKLYFCCNRTRWKMMEGYFRINMISIRTKQLLNLTSTEAHRKSLFSNTAFIMLLKRVAFHLAKLWSQVSEKPTNFSLTIKKTRLSGVLFFRKIHITLKRNVNDASIKGITRFSMKYLMNSKNNWTPANMMKQKKNVAFK